MPQANEKVLAMVRQELKKDPNVTNKALLTKAKRMNRAVGRLSPRQFHAKYRLKVSREMAPSKPRAKRATRAAAPKKAPASDRGAVRSVLLELATEVAAADKAAMVGVVASLDKYVDRIVGSASRS
jgi:hypothetical protein